MVKKSKSSKKKSSKKTKSPKDPTNVVEEFINGEGEFEFTNGDKYIGQYCAHRSGLIWREGQGKYFTKDGQIYEGEWKDDKLVENKPLNITFQSGAEFSGIIAKNKYSGPGCYTLENKLKLLCNFINNKPQGELIFLSPEEKFCFGEAGVNGALVFRENIFFANLNDDRGKGKPKIKTREKQIDESASKEITGESPSTMDQDYWKSIEKVVFAKSMKTPLDLNFLDSPWYQNYINFKNTRKQVYDKIKSEGIESLSEEDRKWYDGYMQFKERRKDFMVKKEPDTEARTQLLEMYFKEELLAQKKCVPVIFEATENSDDTVI